MTTATREALVAEAVVNLDVFRNGFIMVAVGKQSWVPVWIPGLDESNTGTWFAYNRADRRSIVAATRQAAVEACRQLNRR